MKRIVFNQLNNEKATPLKNDKAVILNDFIDEDNDYSDNNDTNMENKDNHNLNNNNHNPNNNNNNNNNNLNLYLDNNDNLNNNNNDNALNNKTDSNINCRPWNKWLKINMNDISSTPSVFDYIFPIYNKNKTIHHTIPTEDDNSEDIEELNF